MTIKNNTRLVITLMKMCETYLKNIKQVKDYLDIYKSKNIPCS